MQLFVRERERGEKKGRDEYIVVNFLEQRKKGKKQGKVGTLYVLFFIICIYLMTY